MERILEGSSKTGVQHIMHSKTLVSHGSREGLGESLMICTGEYGPDSEGGIVISGGGSSSLNEI
jgi:hypothetical protein